MRRSATAVVLATLVALAASAPSRAGAAAPAAVSYRPPVDAPVVDGFRPPANDWNAGNRGLEYATAPGTPVAAAASGQVVFAGPVAGGLHVVVLHDDGLRTSYSFLATVSVRRGDKVRQGQTLGTAKDGLHFGARAGEAYLDPAKLFGGGPPEVHLVPDELRRPQSEAQEREGLARMLRGWAARALSRGEAAVDWAKGWAVPELARQYDELRGAVHFAREALPSTHTDRFVAAAAAWRKARQTCTPDTVAPPKPTERRILVRVGGLGSSSDGASVDDVDAAGLGYASTDVVRFSYRGGTTAENGYTAADTTTDLRESGRRLGRLLGRIEADNPGVPIDVVAHSQGGLVALAALTDEGDPGDGRPPRVNRLVTLGTPHLGAPAATGVTMTGHTTAGEVALTAAHTVLPGTIDPAGTSVAQMAEESGYLARLRRRPLPPGLKATSIAAREDLVVPAGRTLLAGANNVTVSVPGLADDHGRLTRSPQARREIALALAGMNPTCQSFADAMADAFVSEAIYTVETGLAGSAWMGARRIDKNVDAFFPDPTVPRRYE